MQVYTPEKVQGMLQQLEQEAFQMMLFLKSVERLEVLHWPADATQPSTVYTCTLQDVTPQLRRQRALFLQAAAAAQSHRQQAVHADHPRQTAAPAQAELFSMHEVTLVGHHVLSGQKEQQQVLIGQLKAAGAAAQMAQHASAQFGMPLIPWGSVAATLNNTGTDLFCWHACGHDCGRWCAARTHGEAIWSTLSTGRCQVSRWDSMLLPSLASICLLQRGLLQRT